MADQRKKDENGDDFSTIITWNDILSLPANVKMTGTKLDYD
jgi:hypothetical protein